MSESTVRLQCVSCGHAMAIPRRYVGQRQKCRKCGVEFTVPDAPAETPEPQAPHPAVGHRLKPSADRTRRIVWTVVIGGGCAALSLALLLILAAPDAADDLEYWFSHGGGALLALLAGGAVMLTLAVLWIRDRVSQTAKSASQLQGAVVWVFVSCAALLGMVLAAKCPSRSSRSEAERKQEDQRFGAVVACQEFVGRGLVSPASAKFPAIDYGTDVISLGEGGWRVSGYVDSQNRLGVVLRSDYMCVVSLDAAKRTWYLKDINVTER